MLNLFEQLLYIHLIIVYTTCTWFILSVYYTVSVLYCSVLYCSVLYCSVLYCQCIIYFTLVSGFIIMDFF